MPFRVEGSRVFLEGHCSVEEAPDLFQTALGLDGPVFDISGADTMHTAIVQVLIAARGRLDRRPSERTLAACLASLEAEA